jgi:4-hydroxy-L-threonine phosphate dehydrogenase PdxA
LSLPLGITLGDPAGVGAEGILKSLVHARLRHVPAVVVGDVETYDMSRF